MSSARRALITGGAHGMGLGFAEYILEEGGRVCILDIGLHAEEGQKPELNLKQKYGEGRVVFLSGDVRKQEDFEAAFAKAKELFGGIDLLVNNAGVVTGTGGDFARTIDVNLTAVIRGCYLAAEHMALDRGGNGGQIINMASIAGLMAFPIDPNYAASKHGVISFSRSIATVFGPRGISVKCICPSFVKTGIAKTHLSVIEAPENKEFLALRQSSVIMEIKEMVAAFRDLLNAEDTNGAVIKVESTGVQYVYTGKEPTYVCM